ncbi:MAG: peptidoglycan-binding protein, partial [Blastochloris sp.]|nr:peptidoglycan-binding protein [Blastochloris sp.]
PPVEAPPPAPPTPPKGPALRAEPVIAPAPANELEIAAWQVQLERHHFSCGTIDGDFGMRSRRAITQFQLNRGLPVTGELDFESRMALGTPGNPFKLYTVRAEDMAMIQPTPILWADKAKADYLGYNDAWEMLSEKFHTSPAFLKNSTPASQIYPQAANSACPTWTNPFPCPRPIKSKSSSAKPPSLFIPTAVACLPVSPAPSPPTKTNAPTACSPSKSSPLTPTTPTTRKS